MQQSLHTNSHIWHTFQETALVRAKRREKTIEFNTEVDKLVTNLAQETDKMILQSTNQVSESTAVCEVLKPVEKAIKQQ